VSGAFFTGRELAAKALTKIQTEGCRPKFFDPACGTGDLLLEVARRLEIRSSLYQTLKEWGKVLAGQDVNDSFTRATRARLAILALNRGAGQKQSIKYNLEELFPLISTGDSLLDHSLYTPANQIIMNPPFNRVAAPINCTWGSGKVTAAALFLELAIRKAVTGTHIIAILPDVLRSGSRYNRWRRLVSNHAVIKEIRLCGVFNKRADINVFILDLIAGKNDSQQMKWYQIEEPGKTIQDYFHVSVGPVVPYRDKDKGNKHPYVHAKALPKWSIVKEFEERRGYDGKLFKPPFVVVRRTSRPGDERRAIATIIRGIHKVAVENHLIVIEPEDGTLKSCKSLIKHLNSDHIDQWLDQRIRCRHLTVSAVKEIPWWGNP